MTSSTNLIWPESDLEDHIKRTISSDMHEMEPVS
jgi:hypothetical protein